ncbi:MAG: extracellular solute-binding protein [Clostridia bacterium]|nr:extracellular solute-binding protein [Clostridia bacterium]
MKKRKIALFVASVMALTMLSTACGDKKEASKKLDIDLSSYPIETDVTLSYFLPLRSSLGGLVENLSETHFAQELEKRTGVKVEYIHAAIGQEAEMLSLLIASEELPDMMQGNWLGHKGGVDSAIDDGVIVDLGEYREYAPAYFGKLEAEPQLDKAAKTDSGRYSGFSLIQNSDRMLTTTGPVMRADWLEELGLEIPTTIDEWEEVLTAFKEKKGAVAPFSASTRDYMFAMFGVPSGYFIEDGEYKYAKGIPEAKRAVERLNDWYKKGLLDVNIASVDAAALDTQILTGKTGAATVTGGDIGRYMNAAKEDGFDLVGIPYPTFEEGGVNNCVPVGLPVTGTCVTAISAQSKYPELAAKWLDYLYTEEGTIFANFGTEGVSYEMVDGEPIYTDLITNNPDGLSMQEALGLYVKAGASGSFDNVEGYINQYYSLPQQKGALDAWQQCFKASFDRKALPVTLTTKESQEVADLTAEISPYANSMMTKFVIGTEPLDKFDEYLKKLSDMGVQRVLDIHTEALKRYNAR